MNNILSLKVHPCPIEVLIPYARNSRTHSDEQVAQIAASIREFGFTNPVLVDGNNGIIAGHGRVLAARKLGLSEVPCIELSHLSETQKRAYIIADNKLALNAGWDEEMLALELGELSDLDFNLDLTGFDADEIANLLFEPDAEQSGEEDIVPEVEEQPITKPREVWLLGKHRLICGDATNPVVVSTLMENDQAHMAFTDPPYNVNYANSVKDKMRGTHRPILNDNLGVDFAGFLSAACTCLLQHTQGAIYIAMSSSELDTLQQAFRQAGGKWSTFVIWAKNTFTLGRADYQRQYEPILYGWPEGAQRHWCGDRDQGDVWFINKPLKNDLHPTMKPVELVERAIRNSSRPGDLVLDLFGGSGTTLIAAEKTQRCARIVELDPKYVDVIIRRWQEYTGEQATREADGRWFDDIVADSQAVFEAGEGASII